MGSGLIGFSVPTPDCRSAQASVLLLFYIAIFAIVYFCIFERLYACHACVWSQGQTVRTFLLSLYGSRVQLRLPVLAVSVSSY